ncbi:MAG: hypothetical protein LBU37_10340 [Tannerellaceae bacterium]|jgi:hypothetical protein|nr:hypothetical protein [Tannerellaceae bacterium]
MRRTGINEQKEEDIKSAYKKAMLFFGDEAPFIRKDRLVKKAMEFPAPRFYISYEEARRILSRMDRGVSVDIKRKEKRKMYQDLLSKLREQRKNGKATPSALQEAINTEAPGFYIGREHFTRIINRKPCI